VETLGVFDERKLLVFQGGVLGQEFTFGANGEAEALVEWFDAHAIEIKAKPPKKAK
jgi:hypothetical protein